MKSTIKYYEHPEKIGSVTIDGMPFQLCDHIQKIQGCFYATAFSSVGKPDGCDTESGIFYKTVSNANLAFIPLAELEKAKAVYDDHSHTNDMKKRLIQAMQKMNAEPNDQHAA